MLALMADPRIAQINALIHTHRKNLRWLAENVSSSPATISNILNGVTKDPRDKDIINRMLAAFEGLPPVKNKIIAGKQILRPVYVYSHIMAGPPNEFPFTEPDEYELVPDWGGEFERWGRKISGDSMYPILQSGDIAIFENRRHDSGHVVQAFKDGEDCVKAYRLVDGEATLSSFNDDGPSFPAKGWEAKGVCVMRIRNLKHGVRQVTEFPSGLTWSMRNDDF